MPWTRAEDRHSRLYGIGLKSVHQVRTGLPADPAVRLVVQEHHQPEDHPSTVDTQGRHVLHVLLTFGQRHGKLAQADEHPARLVSAPRRCGPGHTCETRRRWGRLQRWSSSPPELQLIELTGCPGWWR